MSNLLHLNVIGKGKPLVLLHGWGWHSGIWSSLVPHLADKFQLFMPDLPGFGKSDDYTTHYTFEEIASALLQVVPPHAAWIGWSLGGMIAWWIAAHHPEKVTQLTTVAASPKFTSADNWPGVELNVLNRFSAQLTQDYEQTITDFLALQLRNGANNQELFAKLKPQLAPMQATALTGGLRLLSEADLRPELSQLNIPSLHIFGGMDTLVPARVMAKLQPLVPLGDFALIKKAGHIPFLSHQDEFLQLFHTHFCNT